MAVSSFGAAAGGLQPYEQIFTSSGTWTRPTGVKTVEVTCIGGTRGNGSYYPTAASGYFKGILDVSSLSTVAVTVGAPGDTVNAGGTSSFGNLVVTPDGYAGGYYFPTQSGYTYPLEGYINFGYNDNWLGFAGGSQQFATANDGQLAVIRGNTNGYVVTTANGGNSWVGGAHNGGPDYSTKILKNSSGNYFAINLYDPSNNPYISGSYSTNGTSWNNSPTGLSAGYNYGFGLGPAGFLIAKNDGWFKSTDGATWTSVTPTGSLSGQGNQFRVHGTSTRYYAIPTTSSGSTIYTSTDGVAWTSFSAAFSYNAYQSERYWCVYNDKLYHKPDSANWLGVIEGTSSSSVTSVNSGYSFITANVPFFRNSSGNGFYHVDSPASVAFTYTAAGSFNGMFSNGSYLKRENTGVTNLIIKATLYAGSTGVGSWTAGSATQGSPGVRGPGVQSPNATYAYPAGGPGNEDGWGCGAAGGSGLINLNSKSYGSGVSLSTGNQGAVRVRWWA